MIKWETKYMNVEGFISVKIKCKDFFYAQNDKMESEIVNVEVL